MDFDGARLGSARQGAAEYRSAWQGRLGVAWRGLATHGMASLWMALRCRHGQDRLGVAWHGRVRRGRLGYAVPGKAWRVRVRQADI